jgi:modulator of FtsH protease
MSLTDRVHQTAAYSGQMIDAGSYVEPRRVLRNTYLLLSMTLAFSAATAALSATMGWPAPGFVLTLIGYFGLLFAITKFRNSAVGVGLLFVLTGFMGYTLGPIINHFMHLPNGGQIVMMAMGSTAAIFLTLSGIALTSKRDFSFLGNFLMVGMIVAILASLAAYFFSMPVLSLAVSAGVVLLMSGYILYQTSAIVQGGETNYVMATLNLFITLFNLFVNLLQIFGVLGGDD